MLVMHVRTWIDTVSLRAVFIAHTEATGSTCQNIVSRLLNLSALYRSALVRAVRSTDLYVVTILRTDSQTGCS